MDRGRRSDPYEASTQAEDGSPGCPADSAINAGKSLSADLGGELGESRSTATAVASASHGAGAHPDHESAAIRSPERRATLQEEVMAGGPAGKTGVVYPLSPGGPGGG